MLSLVKQIKSITLRPTILLSQAWARRQKGTGTAGAFLQYTVYTGGGGQGSAGVTGRMRQYRKLRMMTAYSWGYGQNTEHFKPKTKGNTDTIVSEPNHFVFELDIIKVYIMIITKWHIIRKTVKYEMWSKISELIKEGKKIQKLKCDHIK